MLNAEAIVSGLGTREVPGLVYTYESVGSTMDEARRLLARHPTERALLVVAEEQTAGRGRLGRSWQAPAGSALLFTLALRPHWLAPAHAISLIHLAAVALCEGVATATSLRAGLKWPNDLILPARSLQGGSEVRIQDSGFSRPNAEQTHQTVDGTFGAKAGGILLESTIVAERLDAVLIGCGLNVSASPPLASVRYPATSLTQALGAPVDRLAVLRAILVHFDAWYIRLAQGDYEALFAVWRRHLLTLGHQVRIETAQGVLTGRAEAVAVDGSLLLRSEDGTLHTVRSGDVGLL
jgi:BirA family biotin operon repressor/biotin-[acetyl-CoA-carboxylase] ligase